MPLSWWLQSALAAALGSNVDATPEAVSGAPTKQRAGTTDGLLLPRAEFCKLQCVTVLREKTH